MAVTVNGYSKSIPSPSVFFAISERILNEAQSLIFLSYKDNVKPKIVIDLQPKTKQVDKVIPTSESLWNPTLTLRREGMWIISE